MRLARYAFALCALVGGPVAALPPTATPTAVETALAEALVSPDAASVPGAPGSAHALSDPPVRDASSVTPPPLQPLPRDRPDAVSAAKLSGADAEPGRLQAFLATADRWLLSGRDLPPDWRLHVLGLAPADRLTAIVYLRRSGLLNGQSWAIEQLLSPAAPEPTTSRPREATATDEAGS